MYKATGYRKTAVAQITLTPGEGKITVNEKPLLEFFTSEMFVRPIYQPLELVNMKTKFDVNVKVNGSGYNSQAEAMRNGIAKALLEFDPELRPPLKKAGFLSRDARKKERMKAGMRGARKARQYRKR
jgi:small subunit ribosomal protein S9